MSFRSRLKKELDASVWNNPQKADVEPARPVEGAHPTSKLSGTCACGECVQFGVETEPMRRVPTDGGGSRLIHGRELRAYLDTQARTLDEIRQKLRRPSKPSEIEIHGGEQ